MVDDGCTLYPYSVGESMWSKGPCAADVTPARGTSLQLSATQAPHFKTATMASGYGLAGGTYSPLSF
jgi:hypothetical protein